MKRRRPHSPGDMQRIRDRNLLRAQTIPSKVAPGPSADEWDENIDHEDEPHHDGSRPLP